MTKRLELDLDFQFINVKGEEIPGLSAAQYLAEVLMIKTKTLTAGRASLIGNDLYKNGKIEINPEDLKDLEKDVTEKDSPVNQRLQNNQEVQIVNAINEAKKKESESSSTENDKGKGKGKK